jgi:hypothetical protein
MGGLMKNSLFFGKFKYLVLIFVLISYLPFQNCSQWQGNVSVVDQVEKLSDDHVRTENPITRDPCPVDESGTPIKKNLACPNNPNSYNEFLCAKGEYFDSNGKDDCAITRDVFPSIKDVKLSSSACGKFKVEIIAEDDLTPVGDLKFFMDGLEIKNNQEFLVVSGTLKIESHIFSIKDRINQETFFESALTQFVSDCPPPPPPPFVNSSPQIVKVDLVPTENNACEKLILNIKASDKDGDILTYFLRTSTDPLIEKQIDRETIINVASGTLFIPERSVVVKDSNGSESFWNADLEQITELCDRTPPALENIIVSAPEKSCEKVSIEVIAQDPSGIAKYELTMGSNTLESDNGIFEIPLGENVHNFLLAKESVKVTDNKGNSILSAADSENIVVPACFNWTQKQGDSGWSSCSAECGGTQTAQFNCTDINGSATEKTNKCGNLPSITQKCAGKTETSKACGENMTGEIKYAGCNLNTGIYEQVDKSSCHASCLDVGSKHANLEHGQSTTDAVTVSEALKCSFNEPGLFSSFPATRTFSCTDGKITEQTTKDGRTPASTDSCPTYSWIEKKTTEGETLWSTCNADCGGTQLATYECRDDKNSLADEARCLAAIAKPTLSQTCDAKPNLEIVGDTSEDFVFLATTASCADYHREPGFSYKVRNTTKKTHCDTQSHKLVDSDDITYGVEKCVSVTTQRCGDESLNPMAALGRLEWMKKCESTYPAIQSFFESTRKVAGSPLNVLDLGVRNYLIKLKSFATPASDSYISYFDLMVRQPRLTDSSATSDNKTRTGQILKQRKAQEICKDTHWDDETELADEVIEDTDSKDLKIEKFDHQIYRKLTLLLCELRNSNGENSISEASLYQEILNFRSAPTELTLGEAIQGLKDSIVSEDNNSEPSSALKLRLDHSNLNIHFIDKHLRTLNKTSEGQTLVRSVKDRLGRVYTNNKKLEQLFEDLKKFMDKKIKNTKNLEFPKNYFGPNLFVAFIKNSLTSQNSRTMAISALDNMLNSTIVFYGGSAGPLDYVIFKYSAADKTVKLWEAPKPVLPIWLQQEIMNRTSFDSWTVRSTRVAPDVSDIPCSPPQGVKASQIFIPALCQSSCTTPEAEILTQLKAATQKSFVDAFVEKTSSLVTLADAANMTNLKFQETPVRRFIRDYDDVLQAIRVFTMASGKKVKFTPNHPILAQDGSMRRASTFEAGEVFTRQDGSTDKIVSVEESEYLGKVYNVHLMSNNPKENIIVTDGYLNGTAYFQGEGIENLDRVLLRANLVGDAIK